MANILVTASKARTDRFGPFAANISSRPGPKWGFSSAGTVMLTWPLTGPEFHYSDTWQLVVNTGTDIATFLMVFLIQNTRNRDARAINLKLEELIRAMDKASNHRINIERLSDVELDLLEEQFRTMRAIAARRRRPDEAA